MAATSPPRSTGATTVWRVPGRPRACARSSAVRDGRGCPQIAQCTIPPCAQRRRARRAPEAARHELVRVGAAPALLELTVVGGTRRGSTAGRASNQRRTGPRKCRFDLPKRGAEREGALAEPPTAHHEPVAREVDVDPPQVVLARALDPDAFLHRAVPIAPLGPECGDRIRIGRIWGVDKWFKSPVFGTGIRRFESYRPSHSTRENAE